MIISISDRVYDPRPAQELVVRHAALQYPFVCTFGSARLQIEEGVFCPTLTNTSPLLLEAIDFRPGERVLDVFAGSGAFGVNAGLNRAKRVVCVDIDPLATTCARKNVRLNDLQSNAEVRQGTVRKCVSPEETFDLIIANPPLLPGDQIGALSVAIFDPGLLSTVELIRALDVHLADTGRCYLLTSEVIESYGYDVDRFSRGVGLVSTIVAKSDFGHETYRVHKIVREHPFGAF
jgi:methylase of polypeptide subunit release factors